MDGIEVIKVHARGQIAQVQWALVMMVVVEHIQHH